MANPTLTAALGKILTLYNLMKRHVIVINRCCLCKKTEKSMDHLLLDCDVASALWTTIFSHFGMSWVMPRQVINLPPLISLCIFRLRLMCPPSFNDFLVCFSS